MLHDMCWKNQSDILHGGNFYFEIIQQDSWNVQSVSCL